MEFVDEVYVKVEGKDVDRLAANVLTVLAGSPVDLGLAVLAHAKNLLVQQARLPPAI
jgi:hypothetical protein